MTEKEAALLLTHITEVHPWVKFKPRSAARWADLFRDIPFDEAEAALRLRLALDDRPPTIAAVRATVVEKRLGLPTSYDAWFQIERRAAWKAEHSHCRDCGGRGYANFDADLICPTCGGAGETLDFTGEPVVHPLAQRAVDLIGGLVTIRDVTDRTWLRRDFLKAFDELRNSEVLRENERMLTAPPALPAAPSDHALSS